VEQVFQQEQVRAETMVATQPLIAILQSVVVAELTAIAMPQVMEAQVEVHRVGTV
tara:strand:+ start:327 stop:491 length:165 start_codon:yes stop_codon:yes gene_type:complete